MRLRPHVAQRPPERAEQNREPDQLERHVDALVAEGSHEALQGFLFTPSAYARPYTAFADGTAANRVAVTLHQHSASTRSTVVD